MIISSLPPIVEVATVGAVALVLISAVVVLFYCTPSWRKIRTSEDIKFEGIECEHEHTWTKATNEQGTSTQRIAYYGTLSLSAQNSPTRHLRSISATNPPTHFLSPSHIRSPRRNSSPIGQQQQQQAAGGTRTLSPHSHVLDLSPYPVQPPYWDPESQQYFHCYGYDSNHASPRRKIKSPSRTPPSAPPLTGTTSMSPSFQQKRSPPQPTNPLTAQLFAAATTAQAKKLTDYSNLYLPQAPKVKSRLLESVDASALAAAAASDVESSPKEKEDILEVLADKEDNFQVILNKNIPKIRTPPDDDDDDLEEEETGGDKEETVKQEMILEEQQQQQSRSQPQDVIRDKMEILSQLVENEGDEKHVIELN